MMYPTLKSCVDDLEKNKHLIKINSQVDPYLEAAEIQRRIFAANGPAVLFNNLKNTKFPAVSNLFGSYERACFIFRSQLAQTKKAVQLKADPVEFLKSNLKNFCFNPIDFWKFTQTGLYSLPRRVDFQYATSAANECAISDLPAITSWPMDGGPFITLPQVFSLDPNKPSIQKSNLGMYRVQLSGNQYISNQEVGVHYQIHRTIGIHHSHAIANNQPLKVSIFVGGPPAHTLAAVMPLPDNLSELMFAGMLAGRRFRYAHYDGHIVSADADFCILGEVSTETKEEGPFGDHLGYYSLTHPFPVMKVKKVFYRNDAIWPFTVVGRPPQEDTIFGKLIHEISSPMVPVSLPGVEKLHAVDAAGVHPLLLAIGSERYVPYDTRKPQEILTQANAILGFNQCSLAKYLFIAAKEDQPNLNIYNIVEFFTHMFSRVNFTRDLHFQTQTTMDTLDYSSEGLNQGSKLVMCAAGSPIRKLTTELNSQIINSLPDVKNIKLVMPGVLAIEIKPFSNYELESSFLENWSAKLRPANLDAVGLVVLCDDANFCSNSIANFVWTCFTKSNPSHDIYGVGSFIKFKHWGCTGPLIIDARQKPHMAPPLIEDHEVTKRVDQIIMQEPELKRCLN